MDEDQPSADATPERTERMLACGAQGYVSKPFNVRELVSTIAIYQSDSWLKAA
jgi:DNA-binding NarL/FixJ family response regulator